jgi:hypothetical protein
LTKAKRGQGKSRSTAGSVAVLGALLLPLGLSSPAEAIDVDIGATLQARAALAVNSRSDMDFGRVDFAGTHHGYVQLGSDGTIELSESSSGLTLDGTTAAGEVRLSGDALSVIQISCETSGTLGDGEGNVLTLMNVEYAVGTGVAFGSGTSCAGLGTSPTLVNLADTPNPRILFGGELDLSDSAITESGSYDAAPAMGGSGYSVRIIYQ